MDFKAELKEKVKFVDEYMEKFLPPEDKYPEIIHKAMRYSVFAGGKTQTNYGNGSLQSLWRRR